MLEILESRLVCAAYEVTTLQDVVDSGDNVVSLREAIALANMTTEKDFISFAPSLMANGAAKITLRGDELLIINSVEINGPTNARLTIDADLKSRVFRIDDGMSTSKPQEVVISNLDMTRGRSIQGGAIYSTEILSLVGCTIQNSSAEYGGAIYTNEMLNIWESTLAYNEASESGGAVYSLNDASVVDSTIAFNSAMQDGGAIAIDRPTGYLVLVNATVTANSAASGGGVSGKGLVGSPRIANSIVAGNIAKNPDTSNLDRVSLNESTNNLIDVMSFSSETMIGDSLRLLDAVDWKKVFENDGDKPTLKINGGKIPTIAIKRGGPAVDRGNRNLFSDIATRNDQRGVGFARFAGAAIDIGAYELQQSNTATFVSASNGRYDGKDVTFSVEVVGSEDTSIKPAGIVELHFKSSLKGSTLNVIQVTLHNGVGTITVSEEDKGIYVVEAKYLGDLSFRSSSADTIVREGKLIDYGDASSANQSGAAKSFPVSYDDNGARHGLTPVSDSPVYKQSGILKLGKAVSDERDGVHSPNATADLSDDGVSWPLPLVASESVKTRSSVWIESVAVLRGKVDAWIDFNRDGDWSDPFEKILDSVVFNFSNKDLFSFEIPAGASVGLTYARFRISSAGGLSPTGIAFDGEVEDYQVELISPKSVALKFDANNFNGSAGVFVRDGMTSVQDAPNSKGRIVFESPHSSEMQLDFDNNIGRFSQTLIVNNLTLQTDGNLKIQLGEYKDSITLLGAGKWLEVSPSGTLVDERLMAEIDVSGSGNNKSIISRNSLHHLRVKHDAGDSVLVAGRLTSPTLVDRTLIHRYEAGLNNDHFVEVVNTNPQQNPQNRFDVNNDGTVSPIDVLVVINEISKRTSHPLDVSSVNDLKNWYYTDVNGDGILAPLDVLFVINELAKLPSSISNQDSFFSSFINSTSSATVTMNASSNRGSNSTTVLVGSTTVNSSTVVVASTNVNNGIIGGNNILVIGTGISTVNGTISTAIGNGNLTREYYSASHNGSIPQYDQTIAFVRKGAITIAGTDYANVAFTQVKGKRILIERTDFNSSFFTFTNNEGRIGDPIPKNVTITTPVPVFIFDW